MYRSVRRLGFLVAAAVVASGILIGGSAFVEAQSAPTLTAEQQEKIKANCVSIKSSLNQLHASDALLRVNRGQMYESLSSKLMDRFNDRLGSNGLDNKAMLTVTGNYRTQLTALRTSYIDYELKLSAILNIDCASKPVEFHTAVEEARTLRKKVHADVVKLHQYIDDYRLSVGDFLLNYERLSR